MNVEIDKARSGVINLNTKVEFEKKFQKYFIKNTKVFKCIVR